MNPITVSIAIAAAALFGFALAALLGLRIIATRDQRIASLEHNVEYWKQQASRGPGRLVITVSAAGADEVQRQVRQLEAVSRPKPAAGALPS